MIRSYGQAPHPHSSLSLVGHSVGQFCKLRGDCTIRVLPIVTGVIANVLYYYTCLHVLLYVFTCSCVQHALFQGHSELLAPKISASRLRGLPASLSQLPIRCMKFTSNSRLVLGYVEGSMKVLALKVTNSLPQISTVHNCVPPGGEKSF